MYTTTISSTTCAIKLATSLKYKHYGGFEYQAEVGLLSRNILIQGDQYNSEPTDNSPIGMRDSRSTFIISIFENEVNLSSQYVWSLLSFSYHLACKFNNDDYGTYPCPDKFLTGFGVHILVTRPATTARFSGLEMFRAGQTNVMGRYYSKLSKSKDKNFYFAFFSVWQCYFFPFWNVAD